MLFRFIIGSIRRLTCSSTTRWVGSWVKSRKADQTTNFLYLCDNQGVLVAISDPISGQHHDLADISRYSAPRVILNADAGFDAQDFRTILFQKDIQANSDFTPRSAVNGNRFEYFDELLYTNRFVIERAFAWLDASRALLIRYETSVQNWLSINILAMTACFIRKINPKLKC